MKPYLTISAISLAIAAGWIGIASQMRRTAPTTEELIRRLESVPSNHLPVDLNIRDRDVKAHEAMVKGDPHGAIGFAMLAGAYLARSREIDSYADAVKAEQAARKSIELRTLGNLGAQVKLVDSLLQEHRFKDALVAAQNGLKVFPHEPTLTILQMDILIELGQYKDAERYYGANALPFEEYPSGKAVLAHFYMIEGKHEEALALLESSCEELEKHADTPSDTIAWFKEKIGECLFSIGKVDAAEVAFNQTATLYPRDYKAYAYLCRIATGRGDWRAAAKYGDQSNSIAPMPDILALVGDAHQQLGETKLANETYQAVVALAGKPSGMANGLHEFAGASGGHGHTLDRQYAMYCADHGVDLDGGYACAIRELQARRDVYAFDTLAWVCLKRHDVDEAEKAITLAMGKGTQDAPMFYHAAKIYEAAGDKLKASEFFDKALKLNPWFNALQVQDARTELQIKTQVAQLPNKISDAPEKARNG